jgi:hypothetical protein
MRQENNLAVFSLKFSKLYFLSLLEKHQVLPAVWKLVRHSALLSLDWGSVGSPLWTQVVRTRIREGGKGKDSSHCQGWGHWLGKCQELGTPFPKAQALLSDPASITGLLCLLPIFSLEPVGHSQLSRGHLGLRRLPALDN